MDTLAHGLWGGLTAGWKKKFWLAFLFGIAPDMCSFGLWMVIRILQGNFVPGKPSLESLPDWLFVAYNFSHSLIIIGALWFVLWFTARNVAIPFLAWPLHIVLDIPTHSKAFFPTPFLFPMSDYTFDGIRWDQSWFMILNYGALFVVAFLWVFFRRRRKVESGLHRKNVLKDQVIPEKVQS